MHRHSFAITGEEVTACRATTQPRFSFAAAGSEANRAVITNPSTVFLCVSPHTNVELHSVKISPSLQTADRVGAVGQAENLSE